MTWLLPAKVPAGGEIRVVGRFDRRAYARAYYHAKRKPRKQTRTPEQRERRRLKARERYYRNILKMRADARAHYWRHRDRYAAASRERQRKVRAESGAA